MESNKENILNLKVMRLTRPTFNQTKPPITCEYRDGFKEVFEELQMMNGTNISYDFCTLDQALTLPQNSVNMYLGEVFTSHINLNNDSDQTCSNASVKVELQTSSQRIAINNPGSSCNEIKPGAGLDEVIHHEVKELGTNFLVCSVTFHDSLKEKHFYRKLYKFQVLKPLDVKTKFYNTDSDCLFFEAQIENTASGPLYLEKVSLEADEAFTVKQLNHYEGEEEEEENEDGSDDDDDGYKSVTDTKKTKHTTVLSIFHPLSFINTKDTRQYLYKLTLANNNNKNNNIFDDNADKKIATKPNPFLSKGVLNLGKLDISWQSCMGERGRLQTSQLNKVFPGSGDLKVRVVECSGEVYEGEIQPLVVCVTNCCDRMLSLRLQLESDHSKGFSWCGVSNKNLGSLESGSSLLLHLEFITTATGLIIISGLCLLDCLLNRRYEHDDMLHVLSLESMVA